MGIIYLCNQKRCAPEDNPGCKFDLCQYTTDPEYRDKEKGSNRFAVHEHIIREKPKANWVNVKQRKKRKC